MNINKPVVVDVAEETRGGVMEVGRTRVNHLSSSLDRFKALMGDVKLLPALPVLFEPDIGRAVREMICPYCSHRIYYNRDRTRVRCKSKVCKGNGVKFNIDITKFK